MGLTPLEKELLEALKVAQMMLNDPECTTFDFEANSRLISDAIAKAEVQG